MPKTIVTTDDGMQVLAGPYRLTDPEETAMYRRVCLDMQRLDPRGEQIKWRAVTALDGVEVWRVPSPEIIYPRSPEYQRLRRAQANA